MSPKLPRVTAKKIISLLGKKGFTLARSAGSHRIYKNAEGLRVTVPYHAKKTLHPKVLRSILKDAKIQAEELGGEKR